MASLVFTLEALDAAHGDALLLHYGDPGDPRLIVIDGGPPGVFKKRLDPRLKAIHAARGGGALEIRMLMVSHIDDDHVAGVVELASGLRDLKDARAPLPYDILTLWHNSFDDLTSTVGAAVGAALRAAAFAKAQQDGAAIIASVPQGRQLRLDADALALNMNSGFDDLIRFDASDVKPLKIGAGLSFTVLGPRKSELDALEGKWDKEVQALLTKKKKKRGGGADVTVTPADLQAVAAAFVDTSIHNLSSLVVLAEFDGHRLLLTGDARGDFILASLTEAGLMKNGKCAVDIFKVPHHGSVRNADVSFFKAIPAKHYLFSANGRDDNPDTKTFDLLFKARPTGTYQLWLTNDVAAAVSRITSKKPAGVKLHVRAPADPSIKIELGTPITW